MTLKKNCCLLIEDQISIIDLIDFLKKEKSKTKCFYKIHYSHLIQLLQVFPSNSFNFELHLLSYRNIYEGTFHFIKEISINKPHPNYDLILKVSYMLRNDLKNLKLLA